jgi:F-type H+-transporting ATPase subunit b
MELLTPDLGLFFWNLLAFLIVFYILAKFAWKPILKSLKERETGIADSLATAEKVKQEMAQMKMKHCLPRLVKKEQLCLKKPRI